MGIFHRSHHLVALPLSALLLQVFFLPNIIQAAPASGVQDKCQLFCRPGSSSVLSYETGEYLYDFSSNVTTEVTLASPEERRTKVKAKVVVVGISPCEFTLKVNNLQVNNDGGDRFEKLENLNAFTGRFTLQDGIIGNICLDENEPTFSANIKRAIISLLQNKALEGVSENEVVESDISGRCPTKYSIDGDDYVKTKKLNACLHREGGRSILRGVPYEVNSNFNSVPDLASEQTCTQTLENGIYKRVECTELHKIEKFLKKSDGPNLQTRVSTTLTFVNSKKGSSRIRPNPNAAKTSIYYDYSDHTDAAGSALAAQSARVTLDKICTEGIRPDGVTSEVPQFLLDLKKSLARSDKASLTALYTEIKSGSFCATGTKEGGQNVLLALFLDTAAQSAGDGAFGLLAELYARDELSRVTKRYFYFYATLANHPHVESLQAVLPLISDSTREVSKRLLLAVSGLAHQYCKTSNPNCGKRAEYNAIVDRIAAIVEENAVSTDGRKQEVGVAALQALGNLDHLTPAAVAAIQHALVSGNDRIQVRALDAFRRDPCEAGLKKSAQDVFTNVDNHANLRIGAYLANLRCLESGDAAVIQSVLNDEQSLQVGGFIQSHLTNLLKSSSPSTRSLKSSARQLSLKLQYPKELRKFSRHLESSLFNADLNLGYSAEGSVIFSKESFIPRQLSANLTFDIFGQSYNLFEVGLYLENFDHLQETVFGPHGKFPYDQKITTRGLLNQVMKLRNKRDTVGPVVLDREGLRVIEQQVEANSHSLVETDHSSEAGIGDLYIRVFGTTVSLISLNTKEAPSTLSELKEKVRGLVGDAIRSSKKEIHFIHPVLINEDEVIVPTTSGFGLSSVLEANVVPSLDYSKDYKAPDGDGSPLDLKLKLGSNVAGSLRGRLSLVGGPIETGIQLEANLRTGGAVEIVLFKDANKFEARLNLPNDRVRAFDLSTNVVWIKRGVNRGESKANFRNSLHVMPGNPNSCEEAFPPLRIVGLKLCYRSTIHTDENTPFLLNGRQSFAASLEKTESSMEGYAILLSKTSDGNNRNFDLSFDTPGSAQNRKLSLLGHIEDDEAAGKKKITVELHTPNHSDVTLEYERTNTANLKGILAKLTLPSGTLQVDGHIQKTATGQDELTYEPHLSIEYPGSHADRPIRRTFITGKVVRVPGKKLSVALSNQLPEIGYDVAPLDLFLKGSVEVSSSGASDKHYELKGIELGVRNRDQDQGEPNPVLTINGDLNRKEGEVSTDLEVKYGPTLDYQISVHKTCKSSPGKVDLKTKVILSQFPVLNFDLSVHAEKGEGTYNSLNSVKLGPEGRQVQFSTQTNAVVTDKTHFDVSNKLSFVFQPRSFESTLETHVKNFAGEEQVVAIKVLSSDGQGERTKVTLNFDRKAAQNNDFTLAVAVKAKRGQIQGQLTHVRTALNDATHQSEGYTHSFKHETTFSSQSLSISEDKLVTYIRILNREDAKGASVKSEFTNDNGATVKFEAIAKSLATEIVTDLRLKYKGDELASLEIKGLKDFSNLVLNTYLTNQWRIHAQREYKDGNHCVTNVNAEILSTGRTVTLDVDRSKTGDNTRVVAEAKWDAARDASQSIKLVSDNQIVFGSIHVTSKNQLTIVGQNVELNLEANTPSDISQGEHSASLQYIAPDSRSYEIKYSNALAIDPAHRSSNAKVNINIPEIRPTEISWKVESLNPNLKQFVFDISAEVALSFGGVNVQNMLAKLSASNNVQNGERSVQAKLALGGESIPENILVDSKLVLGPHSLKTENSIQIGTSISGIEIAGDLNEESDVRIGNLKYTLTNLPLSKYQKIEGELSHKRLLSGPLKIQRTHEIKLDGRTALKYNYAIALLNGKLSAETQVTSWDRQLLDANVNGVSDEAQVDLSGHITVNSQNVDVKLHVDRVNPLNLLQIRAETNEDGFSLKLQNTKTSPPTYALSTNVKFHGNVVNLEGELISAANERGLSLKYTRGEGVSREFKGHYVKDGDLLTFDGLVSLSAGQSVTVDGSATKVAGGYEGQVNYHLQSSNANNGVVKFTVVIQDTRRKLSFLAGDAQAPTDFLSLDYTKAETSDKIHYAGSFSTDLFHVTFEEPKLKGTFTADCHHGHGHGNEITATINYEAEEVAQGVIQAELKLVQGELRTFLSVTDTLHSRSFSEEFHVKKGAEGENPRQNKFRWVYKGNDAKTYGITFDSEKNSVQKSLDATLKFIFGDEASDVLGVHVYGKSGKKGGRGDGGLDINLPSRQISATVVTKATGTGGELNVWLDKKRNPNQKLTLTVEYERKQTADGAKGYKYTATLKHPALAKPLTVHREVVRFGDLIVHESVTELDLLDDPNNKIRIEARAAWNDNTHTHLTTKLSVKSEGLGLLLEGEGEVTKQTNSIVANLHYSFKNRNGELNQRNVEVVYSDSHQSILVGEKSDPVLLLSRSVRDLGEHRRRRSVVGTGNSNTVDVRYEVHLPGMRDTRVIDIHLHGSVPPHLNLKTFTTGSDRQDKTYEINLGFPNERQLILGFYRQLAHQKTNLAEFSVALNTTRLLSVKARWDLETLQQVLKTATERFESTGDNLQSTSEVYINEVAQDLQHVLQKLSEALPNLSPLQQRLRGELEEIKSEWARHPTTQQLRQLVDIVISTLEAASEPFQNLLEVLNDFPAYLNQLKAKSPALVKKYEKLVRSLKIQLGKLLKVALQTGRPIILEIQKLIQRIKSRVDGELKSGAENALGRVRTIGDSVYAKVVEYFLDHADDIGHYLEHSSASPEVKEFGVKILRYAVAKLKGQEQEAQVIREEIAQKGRAVIEKLVGELLTVDIKNGVISAIIPLPRPVNSLLDVRNAVRTAFPQVKLSIPYRNRLTSRLNILKQFVKELYSTNLLTAVSKAFRTNAPPHSAQAYIIGSQYFITFDGKLFHHEGHCQYLLLSDFIHKDLTIAIDFENHDGEIKKSIIVADKDETVIIHPDFSVTSEGRTHIEIAETAHEVKLVVEDHEATITCNKDSDVCTVSIDNGYLFGHVAGLLGTYNNEQYDDLRTPAGESTPNTDAFAASWKLNGACTEPTIPNHPPVSSEANKLCSYAFTSRWSPLRSCFATSDAAEYETICKNLSAENGWTVKEAVCTAASAYEQTCGGVNYNHLDFCSH